MLMIVKFINLMVEPITYLHCRRASAEYPTGYMTGKLPFLFKNVSFFLNSTGFDLCNFFINGDIISRASHISDLGIITYENLDFPHRKTMVKKS